MAIEVFNRYEVKYIIDNETCQKIREELSKYIELDTYNKNGNLYTIYTMYFDR